jgi:hypothetical protein
MAIRSAIPRLALLGSATLLVVLAAAAQDPAALQKALNDTEVKGNWNYNDIAAGFAEARKSGRPLLIVFR